MDLPLGSQCKSVGVNRNILNYMSPGSRNIWRNNSWIWNPRVNEGILSPSCDLTKTSSLRGCTGSIKPLDTSIHGSATQERNLNLFCIEKLGVKSVLGEMVFALDPSKQVNLRKCRPQQNPKLQKSQATYCQCNGYTQYRFCLLYQSK